MRYFKTRLAVSCFGIVKSRSISRHLCINQTLQCFYFESHLFLSPKGPATIKAILSESLLFFACSKYYFHVRNANLPIKWSARLLGNRCCLEENNNAWLLSAHASTIIHAMYTLAADASFKCQTISPLFC